ncbi:MAG TPA: tetratricopeptide repeat protein [Candidatus Krumholzibacteria bacterium]|nr:tetratricopeptide repeat protein [Candidatus Krumholzibacteria bacterium]HRX50036.1 tetratricopeptide repeat protein [Candidatus Krumholzibacteria bacterium]
MFLPLPSPRPRGASVILILLCTAVAALAQSVPPGPCDDGLLLAAEHRFDEARPLLVQCLESEGESLPPLVALTMMALEDGLGPQAREWSNRAVRAFPDSVDALYWHGRVLAAADDRPAARMAWEEGLLLDSTHAPTLESLARLLIAQGEERPAYGLLNQLLRVRGPDPATLKTLSDLARRQNLWKVALHHWDQAMEIADPSAADLRHAGELAIVAGDTAYAVLAARNAVLRDGSAASRAVLGEALFAARRVGEAVPVLEDVVRDDPRAAPSVFHLANAYELVGRTDEAGVQFRRYLELAPDDAVGHYNYAIHLDKRGRTAEALREAERAGELAPDNPRAALLAVELREKAGDLDGALAALETLMERSPEAARDLAPRRRALLDALGDAGAHQGQVFLQHIATPDSMALRLIDEDLVEGIDFSVLATLYSVAPTAAKGGELGWVDPASMSPEFQAAVRSLDKQEISPPVRSGGLFHVFRRVR